MADTGTALAGIRVLDLTQFEAGTSCTQGLAWLGADVIKVEMPRRGEQGRMASTDRPDADSHYFLVLNCNKRSITLNLRDPRGLELFMRLVPQADVFVENFAPGTVERLGIDYAALSQVNPKLIYAQIKGFDPEGPYARFLAFDPVAQAMGGSLSITGPPDGPPTRPGPAIADSGAGLLCLIGILAALQQRERSGQGQRVEVTMQDAVINFWRTVYTRQLMSGEAVGRLGNGSFVVRNHLSGLYPCKPGGSNDYCYIYTSRAGNEHWERLLHAIGREDLVGDPRFASGELRWQHREEIEAIVSAWTRERTKHDVLRTLGAAGVPAGAVMDTLELSSDPDLRRRGTFATVDHPVRGPVTVPGWPVKLSGSPTEVRPAPLLGQDNTRLYGELLGLSAEDLAALEHEGVV